VAVCECYSASAAPRGGFRPGKAAQRKRGGIPTKKWKILRTWPPHWCAPGAEPGQCQRNFVLVDGCGAKNEKPPVSSTEAHATVYVGESAPKKI